MKQRSLDDADVKLLLFCINNENLLIKPRIVTEETPEPNDNKGFKKIPSLCKILNIGVLTLPELLQEWGGLEAIFQ